jgi:hypothetical protein
MDAVIALATNNSMQHLSARQLMMASIVAARTSLTPSIAKTRLHKALLGESKINYKHTDNTNERSAYNLKDE